MFEVRVTADARNQISGLPLPIQARIQHVIERLARWPSVSGAKPLRGALKGSFRIRTGGYRVLFSVDARRERVEVFRVADRRDVYE
ncbi:MAG: type II toxin-antitoxin system RelE family toxin [Tepidisphaeraceae bacterium]